MCTFSLLAKMTALFLCARLSSDRVPRGFCMILVAVTITSPQIKPQTLKLTEIPPNNLKHQLIRNRLYDTFCTAPNCIICPTGRPGDCLRSGVIYLISCTSCGDEYLGETARLYVRMKEHVNGKNRLREWTSLGAQRT
ncbi:hypothetical protein RB195_015118 [Necator americanus]|uniref:GIY-YIG domain-containing protein n=1 Tax=Necator americanus TaxID=51031 RepID=A0ABR1E323_NECAM